MKHYIYKILSFKKAGPYTLNILFNDKSRRTINFEPVLAGELYGPLRISKMFDRVQLDPEVQTLVWPNGADFDPATLHDWPKHLRAFVSAARRWRSTRLPKRQAA
jgi:hypothetical protein